MTTTNATMCSTFGIGLSRWLLVPILLLIFCADASAQRRFPHLFELDSRLIDTLSTPDPTSAQHRYRVTAWGTYSMWEDTVNSSVDPVWIYSFPDEEWAKPEWRLFPEGYPIYVGDSRMFDSHGLRVNDSPFPELPHNESEHKYSTIIRGDGGPITTSIIDWNFRGLTKRDAHDNNSGYLYVLVEELPLTEMEVCAVDSSGFPTIRVSLKVLRDSTLYEGLADNLRLIENGRQVEIDSADCSERLRPVSVAIVLDRSGSMREEWGSSTRIQEVKIAGRNFVDRLLDSDEAAIYSFSGNVRIDQTWTNNRSWLKSAIDRLSPDGYTAMNDAIASAIDGVSIRPARYKKAVVVLSDGEDNISNIGSIREVIDRAVRAEVPVFAIGLLLENDDSLRTLAAETGGQYFAVSDASAIDSVFNSIAEKLFEKGCCNVWYRTPSTTKDGSWRTVEAAIAFENDTTIAVNDGYWAPFSTTGVDVLTTTPASRIIVTPNPAIDVAVVEFQGGGIRSVSISMVNSIGRQVLEIEPMNVNAGHGRIELPVSTLPTGRYFVRTEIDGRLYIDAVNVIR